MELKAGTFRHDAVLLTLVSAICLFETIHALTDNQDVYALNQLYTSLGPSPVSLMGWSPSGGDPCVEAWQGVACAGPNVTNLNLTRLNLIGELPPALQNLTALIVLDLSHNLFFGGLPPHLPPHIQQLDLSANQFVGNIPFSFSTLSDLTQLNLSNNNLSGILIDMWDQLEWLQILDLSNNEFVGPVPLSFQELTSLTKLYLQNNEFSGSINILADLPLTDLNLSNNKLTGWIPQKLQTFPSSSFEGNLFNTFPAPPPPPPPPPSSTRPVSGGPNSSINEEKSPSTSSRKQMTGSGAYLTVGRVIGIAAAGLLVIIVVVLIIAVFVSRSYQRKKKEGHSYRRREEKYGVKESLRGTFFSGKGDKKQPFVLVGKQKEESDMVANIPPSKAKELSQEVASLRRPPPKAKEPSQEVASLRRPPPKAKEPSQEVASLRPPPKAIEPSQEAASLRPPPLPYEGYKPESNEVEATKLRDNNLPEFAASRLSPMNTYFRHGKNKKIGQQNTIEAREYTIAELQVATQSFSVENLIGEGILGKVYKAEFSDADGKMTVVAVVKKLECSSKKKKSWGTGDDAQFLDLLSRISRAKHPNITKLLGYCISHGERLLVYDYVNNGSLHDTLHSSSSSSEQEPQSSSVLSWEARVRIALDVARALEYLHEKCDPPLFHCNLTSANILLDDHFLPHLSDSGLLLFFDDEDALPPTAERLAYSAPEEEEEGGYKAESDIYSFGVVMLELLTGRKAFDGSKPRPQQHLVRWAVQQLHDIDALQRMLDPLLLHHQQLAYNAKSLSRFADVISRCVQTEPEFRPPMSAIIQDLELLQQM